MMARKGKKIKNYKTKPNMESSKELTLDKDCIDECCETVEKCRDKRDKC